MYTSLEEKRRLLEDLELLDYAVTKRIQKNPKIYTPEDNELEHGILRANPKISDATTMLQKHEVKNFMIKYDEERQNLGKLLYDDETNLHDENIFKRVEYERGDFTQFFKLCEDIISENSLPVNSQPLGQQQHCEDFEIYDMFSSNSNYHELKRKIEELEDPNNLITQISQSKKQKKSKNDDTKYNILSSFGADIKLSLIFTQDECFGTQVNMKSIFNEWLSLPRFKSISTTDIPKYKTFLKKLKIRDSNIKVDTTEYRQYLKHLYQYLIDFINRVYPLESLDDTDKIDDTSFDLEKYSFEHPSFFCLVCNKQFSKNTVYDAHLQGKKHKKAVVKMTDVLKLESKIVQFITDKLSNQLTNTITELERVELLTVRERELEKREYKPIENGELVSLHNIFGFNNGFNINKANATESGNYGEEEEDEDYDEKLYNPLNLPIGADGRPIPFWLWKLKGLGHEFYCEICGNKYKGRSAFNKHFREPAHIEGLKKMGVKDNFNYFKDLSTKKEVEKLLNVLQQKYREELHFIDNMEQVEDDQGNAMNKKVYEQLKKQGLL